MFADKRPELELHSRQVVHVCPQLATSYYHMRVINTWRHGQSIAFALQGSARTSGPHCQLGLVPEYYQNLNPKVILVNHSSLYIVVQTKY